MGEPSYKYETCRDCKYCILKKYTWLSDKFYCTIHGSKEVNPENPACPDFSHR